MEKINIYIKMINQSIYLGFGDFTALDVLIGGVGGPPGLLVDLGTAPLPQLSAFL